VNTQRDKSSGRNGLPGFLARVVKWAARSAGCLRELVRLPARGERRRKARHLAQARREEKRRRKELVRQAMGRRRRRAA
jgi:hypothetical protein